MYTHTQTHLYIHWHTHTYTYTNTPHTHTHIHTLTPHTHRHTHTCVHTLTHTPHTHIHILTHTTHTHTYTLTHTDTYTDTHTHVCIHWHTHTHTVLPICVLHNDELSLKLWTIVRMTQNRVTWSRLSANERGGNKPHPSLWVMRLLQEQIKISEFFLPVICKLIFYCQAPLLGNINFCSRMAAELLGLLGSIWRASGLEIQETWDLNPNRESFSFMCTWSKNVHLYVLVSVISQSQKQICI